MRSWTYICCSVALFILLLLSGCNKSKSNLADTSTPFDHGFVCSLHAGSVPIGGGVVLCSSKAPDKGVLVTARHVITFNREYHSSITVCATKHNKILLGDTQKRWCTVNNKSIDAAWIQLKVHEIRKIKEYGIKLPIAIPKNLLLCKSDNVKIVNAYNSYNAKFIGKLAIQCPLPENHYLKYTSLIVGMANITVPKNNSGSPVFTQRDGKNFFIGTVAISRKNPDATGFIDIRQYLNSIIDTFNSKKSVRLVDCLKLW